MKPLSTVVKSCTVVCGDGIVLTKEGETCDDNGVYPNKTGCNDTCNGFEEGWFCDCSTPITINNVTSPCTCETHCNDGIQAGLEVCDNGMKKNQSNPTLYLLDDSYGCKEDCSAF